MTRARDTDAVVMCNECQRRFESRDVLVDHLEESHGAISALIRQRSTTLADGEPL